MLKTTRLQHLLAIALLSALLLGACAPAATPPAATAIPAASATPPATATAPIVVATAPPPTAAPLPTARPIVINTMADLRALVREIATAPSAAAQARADALMQTLVSSQREPLILGQQVIFFYKGQAQKVQWRGAFNNWSAPGIEGARIGQTDLWIGQVELPAASRAEYKIVLGGDNWIVDPANPNTQLSGLTGDNNVIVMPGFTVTDESQQRAGVAQGDLIPHQYIDSQYLGYTLDFWVYTPVGYENLKNLPVLYVLDGNDFVDDRMGAMPNVLDNLIADKRIAPLLAVFVDARQPDNPSNNRRESMFLARPVEHARFIADELVPAIDRTYRTDPRPKARVITGVSYGGLSATFIAATESKVFHNLAAFSPSLWVVENQSYLADPQQISGARAMYMPLQAVSECAGDTGVRCPALPLKIFLSAGVPAWDVGDFTSLVATLQQQGYPVEFHQVREGHTWSHWRGQTDEMLTYFFGAE